MRDPSDTPQLRLRLLEFRPLVKGALRGSFARVEVAPPGLEISDVPVLTSHGKAWASMPSKPQLTADGTPRRGTDNKPLYVAILRWRNTDLKNRFSDAVVAQVRQQHPDAFAEGGDR
jgi:hypothetical protein